MNQIQFLRVCSDLHLEFRTRKQTIPEILSEVLPVDARDEDSMLILAGDISSYWPHFPIIYQELHPRFAKILHVPGNHEYYGNDLDLWTNFAKQQEQIYDDGNKPISVVNQEYLRGILGGRITIFAITLWASGGTNPFENSAVSKTNDFQYIRKGLNKFTLKDMQDLSKKQVAMLETGLRMGTGPKIVVTHHLPSYSLCDPRHSPSLIDGLFASNYNHLLSGEFAPKIWICGHIHHHIDKVLGDTRVVCNPLGYPNEEAGYEPRCFIDLSEVV
jgi:Icc-related predicted phosphoesterase